MSRLILFRVWALTMVLTSVGCKHLVFICHHGRTHKSGPASTLHAKFDKLHITSFLDRPSLELGCLAQDVIQQTARKAEAAVLLLSPHFITSEYTLEELSIFLEQETFLVPIFGILGPDDCVDVHQAMRSNKDEPE